MRLFLFIVFAGFALSAQGQSSSASTSSSAQAGAATQTGQSAGASAAETSQVSAELSRKLDSKNARVGDEVVAKTISKARLADGTALPRGTKLIGKVTDVQAKAGTEHSSRLGFAFDHAVMRDGSQVPLRAALLSIAAPAGVAGSANAMQDDSLGAGPVGASGGGGGRSGGMIGGGLSRPVGGVVGGTSRGVEDTASGVGQGVGSTVDSAGAAGSVNATGSAGIVTGPVANLPGVSLSNSVPGRAGAVLQATGRNIELSTGTEMTLAVSTSR